MSDRVQKQTPLTDAPEYEWEQQSEDDKFPEALDTSGMDVEEQEDGSAIIRDPEEDDREDVGFSENLAKLFDANDLQLIGSEIVELIERDKEARSKRDKQYEDGLKRTGLGDDAPGGAQFQGASRVVHPVLAEACVDFEARAIKEILPPSGAVRTHIEGKQDEQRLKIADWKRDILNWQISKKIPGYRDEMESMLSQLPMGGSQYKKVYWDGRNIRADFIPIDDLYLPFHVSSFSASHRITIKQDITREEFKSRIDSGIYLDEERTGISLFGDMPYPEMSKAETANNKIEGLEEADAYSADGLRRVYECFIWREIEEDSVTNGEYAPYIIHIDDWSKEVLGIFRNWEEDDEDRDAITWLVDYGFIPWRGAYKIGLPHLIGTLSGALTGALRALLDSAHIANAPTLVKLKQGRMVGQTTALDVTQIQEIEGPAGINDIRQLMMALPFPGPSPVLFQLLGFLTDTAKGVVSTSEEKIADASNNMPVGTSMALIEQGSKVFSAIHMRLHASMQKEIDIICRLNAKYLTRDDLVDTFGDEVPDPAELFAKNDDVIPVSDPNIFSEAQRYAQVQAVLQLMQDQSVPWNKQEVYSRALRLMNVPDPEKLLPKPRAPQRLDAIQENSAAMFGNPLAAYPDQDHLAHIETHLRFVLNPVLGGSPAFSGPQLAPIMQHCSQHLALYYPQIAAEGKALALSSGNLLPDATEDRANVVGAHAGDGVAVERLRSIMQLWQQAQQVVQSKMPPPPMDPQAQVTMQVAQMEDARQKAQMQNDTQGNAAKLQAEAQKDQSEMQLEAQKNEFMMQVKQMELAQAQQFKDLDAKVRVAMNEADNRQHQITELLKNRDDNKTQIMLEQLKHAMTNIFPQMASSDVSPDAISQKTITIEGGINQ